MPDNQQLLALVDEFLRRRAEAGVLDLARFPRALEDLPPGVRGEAEKILSSPSGTAIYRRGWDVLENAFVDAYGRAECTRVLRFLARYPVTNYRHDVAPRLTRGSYPTVATLHELFALGVGTTVNLCAEVAAGDAPLITKANLSSVMKTRHFPWLDGNVPTFMQLVQFLNFIAAQMTQGRSVYVHCEAGTGRTGIAIAAIRMALMGWSAEDALQEAKNFGMFIPMQQAFIQKLGRMLTEQWDARASGAPAPYPMLGAYPRLRPGSVQPTPAQLTATRKGGAQGPSLS